jgi:hypothetical protein
MNMYFCRKTTLGMSKFVLILIGVFLLTSCGKKTGQAPSVYEVNETVDLQTPDTTTLSDPTNKAESERAASKKSILKEKSDPSTTSSSHSSSSSSYDNMRGFDPASENDMDDNGMSRYMENDDDEGWD